MYTTHYRQEGKKSKEAWIDRLIPGINIPPAVSACILGLLGGTMIHTLQEASLATGSSANLTVDITGGGTLALGHYAYSTVRDNSESLSDRGISMADRESFSKLLKDYNFERPATQGIVTDGLPHPVEIQAFSMRSQTQQVFRG